MKQLRNLLLITAILLVSKGVAQDCCFEVSGEWLYMLSAIDQPYYAINAGSGATIFNGDRVANDQEWYSGYRLEASYNFTPLDQASVRWTQFHNFSDSESDDESLFQVIASPSPAGGAVLGGSIRDQFDFYYLEFLYGRILYCQCPFFLSLNAGVQFTHLEFKENLVYQPADPLLADNTSKLRGVGPELGINLRYALFNCLDIRGRTLFAFLVNKKEAETLFLANSAVVLTEKNQKYWYGTTMVDIRLGLSFDFPINTCGFFCGVINIQAGYELIHFMKGVDRIYFTQDLGSFTQQMDFTLHGPYVHLGFCF